MMKSGKSLMKKFLVLAVAAGFGLAVVPSAAQAEYLDFTIDPSALGGPATCFGGAECTADRLDGFYVERFTVLSFDAGTSTGTFATDAYFDLLGFTKDEATAPLIGSGLLTDYAIYALFSATGTFAPNAFGGFDFTASSGSLDLYADLSVDSFPKTVPASSPGAVTVPNAGADDPKLADGTLAFGEGHTRAGPDSGDFELFFDPFLLTALGEDFFIKPIPFYTKITVRGVFDDFVPSGSTNRVIQGVANGQFIPEPATLTLLGLGLLGSGWAARRRRSVA